MRLMSKLPYWLLAISLICVPLSMSQARSGFEKSLVIQVSDNDPAKWNLALNNAANVQADLGAENVTIEVVAYGPGINMLKIDSPIGGRLTEAMDKGIVLLACRNTMRAQNLTEADIYPGVGFVDSGVVHIMQRQYQYWAYVRP